MKKANHNRTTQEAAAWRTLIVMRTLYELDDRETAMTICALERLLEELDDDGKKL